MGLLTATRYVSSVDKIDADSLLSAGVKCVLLDRDNTCVPRDARTAPESVLSWIESLKKAGIDIWMVSNNAHVKEVERSAGELGVSGFVAFACKPFPFAIRRALKRAGYAPREACMIGDQMFTDLLGGNLCGLSTILVRPQSQEDLWYTKIMRRAENALLASKTFEGE